MSPMSYLVLARKYRPRKFAEMVGQEHVVKALTNALQTQRLHHAYLFTGTRGVGKTTVSRILAKSLNCMGVDGQGGITDEPCGVCQACTDIDSGRFVDYTELDAASNRSVDEVQALLEQAVYKPVQGRFKVFMIDEVHMLTGHAFNAMLKTLEEPPEYLKFVLATTDPQKVPVTVLSRCLQFNLRPMAPETVLSHLGQVLKAEAVPAEVGALRLLARAARGSMRDALSLTDQAIAFGNGELQESAVRQMLGSVDRSHVFNLIDALALVDGPRLLGTLDTLRLHGFSPASTLEDMTEVLQRMAVYQTLNRAGQQRPEADETDPEATETQRLALLMPVDETQLLYSLCLHGRAELGLAPDEHAALTMVLLRLLAFKAPGTSQGSPVVVAEKKTLNFETAASTKTPTTDFLATESPPGPRSSLASHETLASQGSLGSSASNQKDSPPVAAPQWVAVPVRQQPESTHERGARYDIATAARVPARFTDTEDGPVWFEAVQQLIASESITALVRELALQSQLMARSPDAHWHLRVERESLNQTATRERLALALKEAGLASSLSVELGAVSDTPARRLAHAAAERQAQAEALVMGHPFVQNMMQNFGAKIVPGSIQVSKDAAALQAESL